MNSEKQKINKRSYESPTTNGLYITFEAYIIELICLNMDKKLQPKFWNDEKYWNKKFRRETRGVKKLKTKLGFLVGGIDDAYMRQSIINVIRNKNIKSLCRDKTVEYVCSHSLNEYKKILERIKNKIENQSKSIDIDKEKNSKFINFYKGNKLSRLQENDLHG